MDASNLLKPALSGGTIRCIGSTTYKEFRNHFEKDRALLRRFQKIDVNEPTVEDTIKILTGLRSAFEEHHKVKYTHRRDQGRGRAVGALHQRPQAARQGDRRDRRGRRDADAGAAQQAQEDDHRQGDRGGDRDDRADPAEDRSRPTTRRRSSISTATSSGSCSARTRRSEMLVLGDQAEPRRACAIPTSRSATISSPARPASARPRSRASSPRSWASRSSASTCPNIWSAIRSAG